jgi:pantothenate kinase
MDVVELSPDGRELAGLLADQLAGVDGVLGICGAPGAGKSTLAAAVARLSGRVVVPMDGFHLADAELRRRGLLDRKGRPETFDAWGYAALLARINARPDHEILAPGFERELEQPLAGAIAVPPGARVVTEGNYLLLDRPEWRAVRAQLAAVWHVVAPEPLRVERLVARHVQFGKTQAEAEEWVRRVDQPGAVLVESGATQADLVIDLSVWLG